MKFIVLPFLTIHHSKNCPAGTHLEFPYIYAGTTKQMLQFFQD